MREKARILKAAEILEAEYGLSRWEHAKHDHMRYFACFLLSQHPVKERLHKLNHA